MRPKREHRGEACPKPYTTVWHAWDYDFPPDQPAQEEPFGHVTVRRLSQRFENHADQYHFHPAGQSPYLDNVDELHAVYTRHQAREPLLREIAALSANALDDYKLIQKLMAEREPLTVEQIDDIASEYSDEFGMIAPDSWEDFARAIIRAAHGITGEKK